MLLDDLLEARVVQLRELGQVVHIGNDLAQILLEDVKVLLEVTTRSLLRPVDGLGDLALRRCYAADDLLGLDALEGVDLVELLLELLDEALLRLLVPDVVHAEGILEAIVVDVVEDPLSVLRRLQLLAEPARSR
jgi:hypothetical protein